MAFHIVDLAEAGESRCSTEVFHLPKSIPSWLFPNGELWRVSPLPAFAAVEVSQSTSLAEENDGKAELRVEEVKAKLVLDTEED